MSTTDVETIEGTATEVDADAPTDAQADGGAAQAKPRRTRKKSGGALVPTNFAAAGQLVFDLGAKTTATSLTFRKKPTYDEWENVGRALFFAGNAWQWWAGDWALKGDELFGEEAAQAIDDNDTRFDLLRRVTGKAPGTLANIIRVCKAIPPGERRRELEFEYHKEVYTLDPDERAEWLDQAIALRWSKGELRDAIREAKGLAAGSDSGSGDDGSLSGMSRCERFELVLEAVWDSGQPTSDGMWVMPGETRAQVGAALGKGE